MPDKRRHRGPDPRDRQVFGARRLPALREAASDLQWLFGRGYNDTAALKLVGDRFQLPKRARVMLGRACCAPAVAARRIDAAVSIAGAKIAVDGFNVLVCAESLLSGGLVIRGQDGLHRDLAGVHGTWRSVEETDAAIDAISQQLHGAAEVIWILDAPVSNSGRLAARLRNRGFHAEVHGDADTVLAESGLAVATADGPLVDRAGACVDLIGPLVTPEHWRIDLQEPFRIPPSPR